MPITNLSGTMRDLSITPTFAGPATLCTPQQGGAGGRDGGQEGVEEGIGTSPAEIGPGALAAQETSAAPPQITLTL